VTAGSPQGAFKSLAGAVKATACARSLKTFPVEVRDGAISSAGRSSVGRPGVHLGLVRVGLRVSCLAVGALVASEVIALARLLVV